MSTATAPDGSPVELYARWLPELGEAELVHEQTEPGATVLELGCGAGRVTRGLVRLGHPVIAVDESEDMLSELAGLPDIEAVASRIEDLDLGRDVGAVVLASTLVNTGEDDRRAAILNTCRRHVSPDGVVLIERMDPRWGDAEWAAAKSAAPGRIGDVEVTVRNLHVSPTTLTQVIEYRAPTGRRWVQGPYTSRLLDDAALSAELAAVGLRLDRWLEWRGTRAIWCVAVLAR